MSSLKATATGYVRYRGQEGHLSFLAHRLSGLATLLFLAIHILDTSTVYFFPNLYDHAIALYRHPLFMVGEIFLVAGVIFHGINGIRISLFDWFPRLWTIERERKLTLAGWGLTILLWLPAAFWMARSLVINNPELFGG